METTTAVLDRAVAAKSAVMRADDALKNKALCLAADFLIRDTEKILQANATDVEKARSTIGEVMLDRLTLTAERIAAMADAVRAVAKLPDPVGRTLEQTTRPDGLEISKVSVPFGVIGIIFESRPNVTSDAAALTLKSGNVCVLRGGKESICSNMAIAAAFRDALQTVGLPENAVNLI